MLTDEDRVQSKPRVEPAGKPLERLLEIVVAQAHETIVMTDGQIDSDAGPSIVFVNDAAAKRTGYQREELIGAPLRQIVLPDAWPAVIGRLRQVRDSKEFDQMELRAKDNAGKEYWIELSTLPVFDENGILEHIVRIGRDVTARKVAEQQREMTQDLLASLFGAIDVPLIVANESGNVMMTNVALQRTIGWSLLDTVGKPLARLVAAEARPGLAEILTAGEGQVQTMRNAPLLQPSGSPAIGNLQVTKVKSPNRQNYFVVKLEIGAPSTEALRAHTNRPVVAGKLQLVGFSALKEELGSRWPELNERVFGIADQVIRKHLHAGDVCQRSGTDGFLVFFEHLEEADAQAKAAMIGEEVRHRLMGELPEGVEMQIAAYAAQVSVPGSENMTEQSLLVAFSQRLEGERQRQEASAVQAVRRLFETAKPFFKSVETIERQPAPLVMARLPDELREAIATLASLGQPAYSVEADAFMLAGSGAHVIANLPRGTMPLILVPVRFCNFSNRRDIEAIVKTARSIGDAAKGQIAIEITEVPRDIIRTRLADSAMRFAPLVRSVAFELPTAEHTFAMGLPMSTRLATIPVGLLRDSQGDFTTSAAERLVKTLQIRQCRLIVKGVDPTNDLPPLKGAGVPMVACAA
jgi:PAS domain S-box-containing protein